MDALAHSSGAMKFVVGVIALLLVGGACGASPSQAPGSRMYMRGLEYGRIRLNATESLPQTVMVSTDKVVVRNTIPVEEYRRTWIVLTDAEFAQVQALQRTWCADPPRFPTAVDPVQFYDVGFRCNLSRYEVTQWAVPPDQLPDILRQVIRRSPELPPVPQPR